MAGQSRARRTCSAGYRIMQPAQPRTLTWCQGAIVGHSQMAKNTLRGAQAPGANLASAPATAMDAWRANVDANKANIRKACDAALTSDVRGYSDQLAASTA